MAFDLKVIFSHDCSYFWDYEAARFSPCAVRYLPVFTAALTTLIALSEAHETFVKQKRNDRIKPTNNPAVDNPIRIQITGRPAKEWTLLGLLAVVCVATQISQLVLSPSAFKESILLLTSWTMLALLLIWKRPQTSPASLLLFYATVFIMDLAVLLRPPVAAHSTLLIIHGISALIAAISMVVLLIMPYCSQTWRAKGVATVGNAPTSAHRGPEDDLSLYQFLTVSWVGPLIWAGRNGNLDKSQVWRLPFQLRARRLHQAFCTLQGTISSRLCKTNRDDIVILIIVALAELGCESLLPLLLSNMLRAMQNPLTTNRVVMTYALLSLGFRWAYTQLEVLRNWYGRRCYERSRGEVTTIIFGKALSRTAVSGLKRISNSKETQREQCPTPVATLKPGEVTHRLFRSFDRIANTFRPQNNTGPPIDRQPASIGTILNLFRGDVHEIAQHFWEVDKLVKGPVGLILASVLVWKFLGPSCFLGILSLTLGQIVSSMLTKSLIKTDRSWKKATDHRLQLTSQFIEVIRYLRWYGWQEHWLKLVGDSRQKELTALVKFKLLQIIIRFINVLSSSLLPAIALYAYTLIEKRPLTIDIIFPALQLFRILDSRLTAIPDLFSVMTNVSVSLRRIEDFMDEAEIVTSQPTKQNEDIDLRFEDCSFAWPESKQPILKEVNITFSTGLTVVHGKVGAGKSAFLQALLGEMDLLTGVYHAPNQPLGYCAQTPWLQSMSIRDNILFFAAYEQEFYHNVLDACELNPDLKLLADGDLSLIGENGIGLSGGQRARVALARAVYSRPKILLLDDPLSALDDSTAESIARKLFGGSLLRTCTIVLVTYRVELVRPYASQFLEVTDGRIDVRDTGQPSSRASYDDIGANDESQQSTEIAKEFIENEQCSKFEVRARVYWVYAKAGGLQWWLLQVIALLISQLLELLYVWYTKMWGEAYNSVDPFKFAASTSFAPISRFPPPEKNVEPWLLAFLLISVLQPLSALSFMVLETVVVYRVAKRLFTQVMHKVASATFQYYDVTPSGRLMNRLTTDMSNIDGKTSTQFVRFLLYLIALALSLAAIASIAPLFLIAAFALVIVFIYTFQIYLPTSQSLRRLERVSLSPLFTHFGDLLQGLTTIRAFKAQEQFQSRFFAAVDQYQSMDHFYWTLQTWLIYRLNNISAISTFLLTALAVCTGLSPGVTAFLLTAAQNFVDATHALCRQYGLLQMEFVSVERVEELLHVKQEPNGSVLPPAPWPRYNGNIEFKNVTIRYAAHMDPALRDINIQIPGGSSIALVGRTGSGKSTFVQSLLAIVRAESGSILIDGIDVNKVDINVLRHRITYVAQEPVLFSGTIRDNLDPTREFTHDECQGALRRVMSSRPSWTLNTTIAAGGANLSHGERQLIGITRAILRRSAVLLLDEATASIDYKTSEEIQQILREEMGQSTVITVAHRVEAVRDVDYIIKLSEGRIERFSSSEDFLNL